MTDEIAIPKRFPATTADIAVRLLRAGSDNQDRCALYLSGRIDAERMRRAARLMLDAEPILGCRLVERFWRPYWCRIESLETSDYFRLVETADPEKEVERFLMGAIDPAVGPQACVCVVRGGTDTVILRANHETADGGAFKDYLARVVALYRRLGEDPGYRPVPNVSGSRSMRQVARRLSLSDKLRLVRRSLRDGRLRRWPRGNWVFPGRHAEPSDPRIGMRRVPPERLAGVVRFGKQNGFSVNDLLIAAAMRAFRSVINPPEGTPLRLRMTADQRRLLPEGRGAAMCNLSGGYVLTLPDGAGDPFVETARRVRERMEALKRDFIGLGQWAMLPLLKLAPYRWLARLAVRAVRRGTKLIHLTPQITNAGIFLTDQVQFGDVSIVDTTIAGPLIAPPNVQLNFVTLNGALAINLSYYASGIDPKNVERLFDEIERELPG